MGLVENWWPGLMSWHIQATGLVAWISWFFHPVAWVLGYLASIGWIRVLAFAITGETVGDPLVRAGLGAARAHARRKAIRRLEHRLGPERPDRVIDDGSGRVTVLTARPKPEWTETVTIEIDERYFRVEGSEEVADGARRALAYRLREEGPGAIVRRLVRIDERPAPPPGRESR